MSKYFTFYAGTFEYIHGKTVKKELNLLNCRSLYPNRAWAYSETEFCVDREITMRTTT